MTDKQWLSPSSSQDPLEIDLHDADLFAEPLYEAQTLSIGDYEGGAFFLTACPDLHDLAFCFCQNEKKTLFFAFAMVF